jgi:hypothetical protein
MLRNLLLGLWDNFQNQSVNYFGLKIVAIVVIIMSDFNVLYTSKGENGMKM